MQIDLFNQLRSTAEQSGVIFYYTGAFSPPIVSAIGDTLRQRMEDVAASASARRKVFSTFIEMAQNILHYAADTTPAEGADETPSAERKAGALAVGREGEKFFVVCGNPVRLADVPRLQAKLEPLRRMSLEDIKAAYREQLRNDAHETEDGISRGAGLGFLTMARDATEPIDYSISYHSQAAEAANGPAAHLYLRATI